MISLFINAAILICRHFYYNNYGVDPLEICGFCQSPAYEKYLSAPHLSSLWLFNHNASPQISPKGKQRKFVEHEEKKCELCDQKENGSIAVKVENVSENTENSEESKLSMIEE